MANLFRNNLSIIFTHHPNISPDPEHLNTINHFLNRPPSMNLPAKHTSLNEVKQIINKLKIGKSLG